LPAKKAGKEISRLASVAASDFKVNYRLTHVCSSPSREMPLIMPLESCAVCHETRGAHCCAGLA
jgi:hypothetical protein